MWPGDVGPVMFAVETRRPKIYSGRSAVSAPRTPRSSRTSAEDSAG